MVMQFQTDFLLTRHHIVSHDNAKNDNVFITDECEMIKIMG